MVLVALTSLLIAALFIMFLFSQKAVKEEALHKAQQTLEATVHNIDNTLLNVEQSAGNIYWKMLGHINQSDMMEGYCRKLVEGNPYIVGCAIAFEPYFYKDRGEHFMAFYDRTGRTYDSYPYYKRAWYTTALDTNLPYWTEPWKLNSSTDDSFITFCLPIHTAENKAVGVMAVDVLLKRLSEIVLEAKPSPNSFCTLLGKNGSYIVHPDTNKLSQTNVLAISEKGMDASARKAAQAMVAGKTGYQSVKMNGKDCYVFYKPFERADVPGRSMVNLDWSVGIVYPENDIFGDYNSLLYLVLVIAVVGLLLLLLLCWSFIHRQLLPLRLLANAAQRIADGHYDEPIPDTRQKDEVGRLQKHFQHMQQSLSAHVGEMNRLTTALQERGEFLQQTYEQAQEAERMKTNFLYNMTNEMTTPVNNISHDVKTISIRCNDMEEDETNRLVKDIQRHGDKVTGLLNQLISDSERKE